MVGGPFKTMRTAPRRLRFAALTAAPSSLLLLAFAVSPSRADAPASVPPSAYGLVLEHDQCQRECHDERSVRVTDRHTCRFTCDVVLQTELDAAPQLTELVTSTLAWRDACVAECRQDRALTRTDRETCLLTCTESAAALCVETSAPVASTAAPVAG